MTALIFFFGLPTLKKKSTVPTVSRTALTIFGFIADSGKQYKMTIFKPKASKFGTFWLNR
jgi:hypothetical protein